MKLIPCTRGKMALVDDCDFERVAQCSWNGSHRYPRSRVKGKQVFMHRFILDAQPGQLCDHINGDCFDNRRANLRFATHAQNMQNSRRRANSKSRFKGVFKHGRTWWVRIRINGTLTRIRSGHDEEAAARAYDALAKQHYGEFAKLNFPDKEEQKAA